MRPRRKVEAQRFGAFALRAFASFCKLELFFSWLCWILVEHVVCFSCGVWDLYLLRHAKCCDMWDLVPQPGIEPGLPALGAWSLCHQTSRKVPWTLIFGSSSRACLMGSPTIPPHIKLGLQRARGFPGGASGKEPTCQCRKYKRCELDPWVEKIPGRGHGNPLQYSCL